MHPRLAPAAPPLLPPLLAPLLLPLLLAATPASARGLGGAFGVGGGGRAAAPRRQQPSLRQPMPVPGVLPRWPPTYNMSLSSIAMPCFDKNFAPLETMPLFGILSFDWENRKNEWALNAPMTCEEDMLEQARRFVAFSPESRAWVYRNSVWACPWLSSVRRIIADPAYSAWFIPFLAGGSVGPNQWHNPKCDARNATLCSDLFHDSAWQPPAECAAGGDGPCDCGGVPCGVYAFDFRNVNVSVNGQTLLDWYVHEYMVSNMTLLSGAVSGLFQDDGWFNNFVEEAGSFFYVDVGFGNDTSHCTGPSNGPCGDIGAGYLQAISAARELMVSLGGFYWQGFEYGYTCEQSVVEQNQCAQTLRNWCGPSPQYDKDQIALMYELKAGENCGRAFNATSLPGWQQDLANFLLIRGDYAWLGYAFVGCDDSANGFPNIPELHADYGVPVGNCSEVGDSGVFVREFSKASVSMDCNAWVGTVTPKAGAGSVPAL